MGAINWSQCLAVLEAELPEQQFNTWVRPLHAIEMPSALRLLAPNRFVVDWVNAYVLPRISELLSHGGAANAPVIRVEIGSRDLSTSPDVAKHVEIPRRRRGGGHVVVSNLQPHFTFTWFIDGIGSELARSAAEEVAEHPGHVYNPLFLYGGVGLGKTHLMHAIAHRVSERDANVRVAYVQSERFVSEMVSALQRNAMSDFKAAYRSLDVLLIDDIQFIAGKERSQEEFFHTFNELVEGKHQIVLACDRYAKDVDGLEERLKSRFGSGLPVAIEPPDVETCAAILGSKAQQACVSLPDDVACFIAKHIRSNVRELEGALRRIVASSRLTGQPITLEYCKEALKDLIAVHSRLISVEKIQTTVAHYFKLRVADLICNSRKRSVVQPRHIAMSLIKELTHHSLPEIGEAFGGRDHTTVLHACRRIEGLRDSDQRMREDYANLLRSLAG
jgi:chromosomal replication initiator protein